MPDTTHAFIRATIESIVDLHGHIMENCQGLMHVGSGGNEALQWFIIHHAYHEFLSNAMVAVLNIDDCGAMYAARRSHGLDAEEAALSVAQFVVKA